MKEGCLILPAAAGAMGAKGTIGAEGNQHLWQSRRVQHQGWGCEHGPTTT